MTTNNLALPKAFSSEFRSVELILNSNCKTRAVDALIIVCAKYEKQLRRIFVHLAHQYFEMNLGDLQKVISSKRLYPINFIKGIECLLKIEMGELIGLDHKDLCDGIAKLTKVRNKLVHGQLTGMKLSRKELNQHTQRAIRWMSALGDSSKAKFGFDGIARKYPRRASKTDIGEGKLKTAQEFDELLKLMS